MKAAAAFKIKSAASEIRVHVTSAADILQLSAAAVAAVDAEEPVEIGM